MNTDMKKVTATWNKESDSYLFEKEHWPDYQAHSQIILKSMGQVKNKKILDVGSGTGLTDAYLSQNGAEVTLLDISQKSIEFSKKYFKHKGLKANFVIGDAFKMPFAPEKFDIVWNSGVIEHFNDHEKVIMVSEMWKRVKRGGKLIIHTPNAFDLPFQIATLILKMRKKWAFGWEDNMTTGRLKKIFNKAGVKVSDMFAYNPIVGWWFFPFGREITNKLGLNTAKIHMLKSPFGHVIEVSAVKKLTKIETIRRL